MLRKLLKKIFPDGWMPYIPVMLLLLIVISTIIHMAQELNPPQRLYLIYFEDGMTAGSRFERVRDGVIVFYGPDFEENSYKFFPGKFQAVQIH